MYLLRALCIFVFLATVSGGSVDVDEYIHHFLSNYYPDENTPISLTHRQKEDLVNVVRKVVRSHLGTELGENGTTFPSLLHIRKRVDEFLEERAGRKYTYGSTTTISAIITTAGPFPTNNFTVFKLIADDYINRAIINHFPGGPLQLPLLQSDREKLVNDINDTVYDQLGNYIHRANGASYISVFHINNRINHFLDERAREYGFTLAAPTVSTTSNPSPTVNSTAFRKRIDDYIQRMLEDSLPETEPLQVPLPHSTKERLITRINEMIYNQLGDVILRSNGTSYVTLSHISKCIDDFLRERARKYPLTGIPTTAPATSAIFKKYTIINLPLPPSPHSPPPPSPPRPPPPPPPPPFPPSPPPRPPSPRPPPPTTTAPTIVKKYPSTPDTTTTTFTTFITPAIIRKYPTTTTTSTTPTIVRKYPSTTATTTTTTTSTTPAIVRTRPTTTTTTTTSTTPAIVRKRPTTTTTISTTFTTTKYIPRRSKVDSYIYELLTSYYADVDPELEISLSRWDKDDLVSNITRMVHDASRTVLSNGVPFPSLSHISKCIDTFLEERARNHGLPSTTPSTIAASTNVVQARGRGIQRGAPVETISKIFKSLYPGNKLPTTLRRKDLDKLFMKVDEKLQEDVKTRHPSYFEVSRGIDEFLRRRGYTYGISD